MNADHVNAFLVPSVQVLKKMARMEVRPGPVSRLGDGRMDDNVSIIIGLQGRLSGSVVLTAARDVAWTLAHRIAGGDLGDSREGEVRAILAELANTIVGNATGMLWDLGIREAITPPTVIEGPRVSFEFAKGLESVLVPLETEVGCVGMIVSLTQEHAGGSAAGMRKGGQ